MEMRCYGGAFHVHFLTIALWIQDIIAPVLPIVSILQE